MEEKERGSLSVAEAGRRGGEATAARHGMEHYEKIGRLGGKKIRELIKKGKAAQKEAEK